MLHPSVRRPATDLIAVFVGALALRLVFAMAIGGTYDFDEFVLLLLGRDYAHGAVPYSGFMFFHPPGMLLLLRGVEPLTSIWWPAGRVLTAMVDAATCVAVYRIALRVFDDRAAIAAALLYGASPLALVAGARVGQDPIITALIVLGVLLLVETQGMAGAVPAGVCLALATWVKYPAIAFLPAYLVLAGRRSPAVVAGGLGAGVLLLMPFLPDIHLLLRQTIQFQSHRWKMHADVRILTALIWWLAVNPLAVVSLALRRPAWIRVGFLTGAVFLAASQVYYHYFVPVEPFAAVLAAPLAVSLVGTRYRAIIALSIVALSIAAWAVALNRGGPSPLYVTAAHLSDVQAAVRLLRQDDPSTSPVLGDQLEYAYLADRPALDDYFWNVGVLVNARHLEKRVPHAGAVVMSYGASSGYPRGFVTWLDGHYQRHDVGAATVWLMAEKK